MAGVDLSAPFEQIPEQEKVPPDQVRAASHEAESAAITAMYRRTRRTQINR